MSYPFDIKNTITHKKNCNGAQNLMFLYDLKENYCHKDTRLEVKHLPESLKFKDWERSVEEMEAELSMLSVSEVWKNKLYLSLYSKS